MLNLLTKDTRKRIDIILNEMRGCTFHNLHVALRTNDKHLRELNIPLTIRKGSAGIFLEQLVTGKRGNNLCEADDGKVEIKSMNLKKVKKVGTGCLPGTLSGYRLSEHLRLCNINYNKIQNTEFEHSGLKKKNKIIILFYEKKKDLKECIFLGVGMIDLSVYNSELKQDWKKIQSICMQGKAHTLGSCYQGYSTKQGVNTYQYGRLAKTYSSASTSTPQRYIDAQGNVCYAKGKDFRIFKRDLVNILTIIEPTCKVDIDEKLKDNILSF